MAAYAALVSLVNVMEQMQNHPRHSFSYDKKQMESLHKNTCFLLDFIESYNPHGGSREEAETLKSLIASAAYKAGDVIESHIFDQIHAGSTLNGVTSSCFLIDVQKEIEEMDSIRKMAMEVKVERGSKDEVYTYSYKPLTSEKSTMVGFDGMLVQLMEMRTRRYSSRQIIPIVGMGGIGKTTLALNVYEHLLIEQHFDVCLWATISQEYSVKRILVDLLSSQGKYIDETHEVCEFGEQLHKSLKGSVRYLIILEDMWSIKSWEEIQLFLPDNGNGSNIVIMTRLSSMATCFRSPPFEIKFLDKDTSWKLFCKKTFGEEDCPVALEEVGKRIVKKCQGLPLSIVVIAGHLRNSSRTKGYWTKAANDINTVLDSGDQDRRCLSILSLSYSHLPAYLKPCFLFMCFLPEDFAVRVSSLIKFWVAEGFLKPSDAQSLEEIAEFYLKDLVDRNLVLVNRRGRDGKVKSCYIHDLLRDLCLMVSKKEKFRCDYKWPAQFLTRSSLQIELTKIQFAGGIEEAHQKVNLRFLKTSFILSSVSLLWNLQILEGTGLVVAPFEIWELPQLRHLEFAEICLPDPPPDDQQDTAAALGNLQKLVKIVNFKWSENACKRIPNIKKLHAHYDDLSAGSYYCLHNIANLHSLESLNLQIGNLPDRDDLLRNLTFPSLLKKLSLTKCQLHWEDLTMIGSLPHLEVLKLELGSVVGPEWNPVEGEFPRLKYLKIHYSHLTTWNAESCHFPVLECLVLDQLFKLDEIPPGIGELPTLKVIRLDYCKAEPLLS